MKANVIRCAAQGGPDVMLMESMELGEPGQGEVLIRQTAIGLNFMDVYHRGGQYPLTMPSGLGVEAAGVVEKTGAGVTGLKLGDRVGYAGGAPGAYTAKREDLLASAAAVFEKLRQGAIKLHIGNRYPLSEVKQAHQDLEAGKTAGSSLLLP